MATCCNERFLFLHVPKTGGSWAFKAMEAAGVELQVESTEERPHPALSELDRKGRFTFAFVREPVSWYGSTWSFRRLLQFQEDDSFLDPYLKLDFPDFLMKLIENHPGFLSQYYEDFVGPPDDPIDFVGHYENLVDDLVLALRLAGQDVDVRTLRAFSLDNPSGPPPSCPEVVRQRLVESEKAVYERFYPGKETHRTRFSGAN